MMLFWGRVMRVSFGENDLHFRHRDHWREPDKQKKERSENPEGANESPDVDPGREKEDPSRRKEVAMQPADDDDEPLEPHPGVHAHVNEVDDIDVVPAPLEPEELGRHEIAEEHPDPPIPPVRTKDAVVERELLVLIAAVPGNEELHRIGVADNGSRQQDDLRHLVDVLRRS